jgi:hypothetical protein
VDLAGARILPWQSSQEVIENHGEIELAAGRDGRGSRASMRFEGVALSLPRYQLSFPAFAEAGWRFTPRRFGRLRLAVRDGRGGKVAALQRWLFNATSDFDFLGAVSWVDEGRFLVFRPHQGAPPRLWILGPL